MTTIDHDLSQAPPLPAPAPLPESSDSDAVTVALADLIASAEPAVVFSSLAELSVGAFSNACMVDIVEEDQAAYRISYPHSDASPLVALAAPRALGAATGSASTHTVRTRIQVTSVPGHPHYAGVVVHTWKEHHPSHADTTIAQLLVDRAIAVITQERLNDRVQHANEEAATLEAGLESNRQIGMAMGMLMTCTRLVPRRRSRHCARSPSRPTSSCATSRPASSPPTPPLTR